MQFIKVIMQVEENIHIGIGSQISDNKKKALMIWIKKNISEYNIVLLTNIELLKTKKNSINKEEKEISDSITKQTNSSSFLIKIFKSIHKITQQESKIIAYVNPRDF